MLLFRHLWCSTHFPRWDPLSSDYLDLPTKYQHKPKKKTLKINWIRAKTSSSPKQVSQTAGFAMNFTHRCSNALKAKLGSSFCLWRPQAAVEGQNPTESVEIDQKHSENPRVLRFAPESATCGNARPGHSTKTKLLLSLQTAIEISYCSWMAKFCSSKATHLDRVTSNTGQTWNTCKKHCQKETSFFG